MLQGYGYRGACALHPFFTIVLFCLVLYYRVDAFGVGIAIHLVKKLDGDRTMSDNYKCITLSLSPVNSKLYIITLMKLCVH